MFGKLPLASVCATLLLSCIAHTIHTMQEQHQPQASSSHTRSSTQDIANVRVLAAALQTNNAKILEETKKLLNEQKEHTSTISYRSHLTPLTFKDIVGTIPDEIHTIVRALQHQQLYQNFGLQELPNKLLLYGPPGTGKTSLARAIAGETQRTFFFASAGDLINSYQGSGAQSISRIFDEARQAGPAVVFIDEIDGIADTDTRDASGECKRMLYQLFKQLEDCSSILFIAATNFKDKLPEALKSRFSGCSVEIPLPDEHTRKLLFLHFAPIRTLSVANSFFNTLARESQGLSGRDIKNIVQYASSLAFNRVITQSTGAQSITEDDLYVALYYKTTLLPNINKRKIILHSYTQNFNIPAAYIDELAQNTENLTGKQIHDIIEEAKRGAQNRAILTTGEHHTSTVTQDDIRVALYAKTDLLPDISTRKLLFGYYALDLGLSPAFLDKLATHTQGLTAQQIYIVIEQAKQLAEERQSNNIQVTQDDINVALYISTDLIPDLTARKILVRYYTAHLALPQASLNELADNTQGFTGKQIKTVILEQAGQFAKDKQSKTQSRNIPQRRTSQPTEEELCAALYAQVNLIPDLQQRKMLIRYYTAHFSLSALFLDELANLTQGLTAQQLATVLQQAEQCAKDRQSTRASSSNASPIIRVTQDDVYAALYTYTNLKPTSNIRKTVMRYYASELNLSPAFLHQLAQDTEKELSIQQLSTLTKQAIRVSQERGSYLITQDDMLVAKCQLLPNNRNLSIDERKALIDHYFFQVRTTKNVTLDGPTIPDPLNFFMRLAKQTINFNAQDIKQLLQYAANIAQSKNSRRITEHDFWISFYVQTPGYTQHPPIAIRKAILQYHAQQKGCTLSDTFFTDLAEHTYHYNAGLLYSLVDKAREITKLNGELGITQSAFYVAFLDICIAHNCVSHLEYYNKQLCINEEYAQTKREILAQEVNKAFIKHILRSYQHTLSEEFIAKLAQAELMYAYGGLKFNQEENMYLKSYVDMNFSEYRKIDRRDQIHNLIREAQTKFAQQRGDTCITEQDMINLLKHYNSSLDKSWCSVM